MKFVLFINGALLVAMSMLMVADALIFAATRAEFTTAALIAGTVGGLICLAVFGHLNDFTRLHAFLLTGTIWITAAAAGALPMWIWQLSFTDAFFEAMSGITTTGSTVMTGLDATAPGILMWRAVLQWIGGIGFIVTGIAFLPVLRTGGMQLFRTESSERGEKEMISATRFAASTVWVYVMLTATCAVAYFIGGMNGFEAIIHALTTLSTGGYSTSDSSFGHFESPFLQWSGTVFMVFGALPFAWYIRVLERRAIRSEQVAGLLLFFLVVILVITAWRVITSGSPVFETLRLVAFNVVSVVTTTGFATTDYTEWGDFAVIAFLLLTAVGGCTGSTAGGAKMMRWLIVGRSLNAQIKAIHSPNAVTTVRYESRRVEPDVLNGVISFFYFYLATIIGLAMGLGMFELDLATSVSAALTAVANVGPGIGSVIGPAGNFSTLPSGAKWLLSFGMYAGRLELLTVLILLTPLFWREVRS